MAQNVLSRIKANKLYRINVAYNIVQQSVDTFIGREAHIEFLNNKFLMEMTVHKYAQFFT